MKYLQVIAIITAVMGEITVMAQNPYDILNKHIETSGGLDAFKAIQTTYTEGNLEILGTGLKGTVKRWDNHPLQFRQEVDLGVFKQVSGDSGEFRWIMDANGNVQINKDDDTLNERRLSELNNNFEYLNPESDVFTVIFKGLETLRGDDCYIIEVTNTVNDVIKDKYIRSGDFYLIREVALDGENERITDFSDFREVGGIIVAFQQDTLIKSNNQRQKTVFTKYKHNVAIDGIQFSPSDEDNRDFQFVSGDSAEDIPFKLIGNHIFLEISLDSRPSIWLLDSGAGRSVIEKNFAQRMGLKIEGKIEGKGAHGTVDVNFTTLPPFTLPGIAFGEQKIITIDMADLFKKTIGMDIHGILGYDFLSRFVSKIDYEKQRLSLYDPDTFEYSGSGKVIDAPMDGNMFAIPVTVDGKYSGKWTLDLGAGDSGFHYPFAAAHNLLNRRGVQYMARGAGARFLEISSPFNTIELGGFILNNPILCVPTEKGMGAFASADRSGNLGNAELRHFNVYLNYKQQQVILEKSAGFERKFPRDNSGMQVELNDAEEITVFFVSKGTPAEKAGFREGDQITAINGIPIEHLNGLKAVRALLKAKPKTRYSFEIKRGDATLTLKLKLQDLFKK